MSHGVNACVTSHAYWLFSTSDVLQLLSIDSFIFKVAGTTFDNINFDVCTISTCQSFTSCGFNDSYQVRQVL